MRQHTNTPMAPVRKIPLAFNTLAAGIGTAAPNTLRGGVPSKLDAMAFSGADGVFSMYCDAATQGYTLSYWSEMSQHWVFVQPTAVLSTISADAYGMVTWQVPEKVLLFIYASATNAVNAYTTGTRYSGQVLKDLLP